ncbi:GNAT family N-acetyltransferase [Alkalinema pantanalense CENA528]|uniref:GNAT family N-acetyltransferase n=1 Tax=Alkalinema pantanalense TaxID=1620705 RepID=UPI003D6DB710
MPVALETPRLIVRLACQKDVPQILQYLRDNDAFHRPFTPLSPEGWLTRDFWRGQVARNFKHYQQGQALRLFLFDRQSPGVVIGMANFTQFMGYPFYACNLGYGLAEKKQGQGLMQEALRAAIDHVFCTMNYHRIQASYMPRNQRSGNLLKRLGFVIEGEAKNYLLINGVWEDHILVSLTNPHWQLKDN